VPEQSRSPRRGTEAEASAGWWRRRRAAKKRRLSRMSRRKRVARRFGIAFTWLLALFAAIVTALALMVYSVADVPRPEQLVSNQTAVILYSDGSELARVDGGQNRTSVPLSQVPAHVRWAVLAAEDRSFYSDPGVSIKGTLRAAVNDVTGGNRQGGSGITQQYVKNVYTDAAPTMSRKLKELAIALKLSREYSKDQILEYYLNTIYWGRDNTYGIAEAANAYFGVPVQKLTVSQGALLAGIIKAPNFYDPAVTPAAAKQRWTYVVDGMVSTGRITQAERDTLTFPKSIKQRAAASSPLSGPLGMVWDQAKTELPAEVAKALNTRGLRIYTTIDRKAQQAAQQAVNDQFANLTAQQKAEKMRPALTAVNPANGAVLAYYGGPRGSDFDYANGYRPPGSSFKPYTLATALTQNLKGQKPAYAIDSIFDGSQCVTIAATRICNDPSDAPYSGLKRLDYAMKVSLNTTFDGLADKVGPANVARTAWAAGIRRNRDTGAKTLVRSDGTTGFGIGIGDADYAVRPLDQATGFATIANGGIAHPPFFVSKVTDSSGAVVYKHDNTQSRALDPKVANDVGLTLKPIADWSGVALADGRESGAKTGTAGIEAGPGVPEANVGKNSDAWMVGYTPQVSAAVWVGTNGAGPISNADGGQEYGRDLPGKTWKEFMDSYLADKQQVPLPTTQQIFGGTDVAPSSTPSTTASSSSAATSSAPPTTSAAPTSSAPPTTSAAPSATSSASATAAPTCSAPSRPAGCTTAPGGTATPTVPAVPPGPGG
jgi:membrane peptidoglycan carboxypeptidase